MAYRVIPYRAGSRGAAEIAAALGGRVLRLNNSQFRARAVDTLINWGNTHGIPCHVDRVLGIPRCRILNNPEDIRDASNKLQFFQRVQARDGEIIPAFWTRPEDIPDNAFPIVCRTVLAGHSGEGIVIAGDRNALVRAPLYVKYVKKQDEYRVHVGKEIRPDGTITHIIDVQQKRRRHDHDNPNFQIRNLANGFIYAREGVEPPACVLDVARRALDCTDLDFGAVDVIYNAREERAYVLEINTAPGITGTTVERYRDFFLSI